jgi:lactate dehydrogenase-like 2-hydroxyacid dehydrogenase
MEKICIYNARVDEMEFFKKYEKELGVELKFVSAELNETTAVEAKGYRACSVQGSNVVNRDTLKAMHENGVEFLALRSIGFNNVDKEAAKEYGIRFSNVSYSTGSVAEFTVMLMMMSLRKVESIIRRTNAHDYSLNGIQGREMHNMTVGIVGTGRIGANVARILTGFGCKIVAYDVYENEALKDILTYVSFDELLKVSDVITLHAPLFDSNVHMINEEAISKMKENVCIVNCGRGPLIDTKALIEGMRSGKIGAVGLDTIEGELDIFHSDHHNSVMENDDMMILKSFPNAIVTPHCSFYTDQAVSDMVENSLKSNLAFLTKNESPWEIK